MKTIMQSRIRFLVLIAMICVGWLVLSPKDAQAQTCQAPNYIEWPASSPVWTLCWVAPPNSVGIDGSGVELRDVYYKGIKVFARAHIPVLNVKYDPGGCGGTDLSYRDWLTEYQAFEADNVIAPGYAEPTLPPRTVCDHPGTDAGTFSGVAVQKLSDRLILTSQLRAGWYRYIHEWSFYPDGTVNPRIYFTAVNNGCTTMPHHHNAYWRVDADLAGAANDLIQESNSGVWSSLNETRRAKDATTQRKWRVIDTVTHDSVELTPGAGDDVANIFAVADGWTLAWHSTEMDDGGATGGTDGDQEHISNYINGENIASGTSDTVLWYRSGTYHNGDAAACDTTGPTLKVNLASTAPSAPPAAPSNLTATAAGGRRINLAWTDNSSNEDGVKIERSTDGVSFTQIAAVGPNVNSYSNTGLKKNRTYTYRVRAYNGSGNSGYSNTATAGCC